MATFSTKKGQGTAHVTQVCTNTLIDDDTDKTIIQSKLSIVEIPSK